MQASPEKTAANQVDSSSPGQNSPSAQRVVCLPCDAGATSGEALGDCIKCRRPVLKGTEGKNGTRSKAVEHGLCIAAFKRRSKQNGKNQSHKRAWNDMSDDEKAEWYVQNAVEDASKKQKIKGETTQVKVAMENTKVRRYAQPYSAFKEEEEKKGTVDEATIKARWTAELMNKENTIMKINGHDHIVKYLGVFFDEDTGSGVQTSLSAGQDILDADDLAKVQKRQEESLSAARAKIKDHGLQAYHPKSSSSVEFPDHLIPGLVDFEDMKDVEHTEFAEMLTVCLNESKEREELLAALFQKDCVAASFYIVDVVEKENADEVTRLRLKTSPEVSKCQALCGHMISDLIHQANEIIVLAKAKLGEGNPAAREAFAQLEGYDTALAKIMTDAEPSFAQITQTVSDATRTAELKDVMKALKDLKQDITKKANSAKRAVAALRTSVKRHEEKELKGVKAKKGKDKIGNSSPAEISILGLARHVRNLTLQTENSINVTIIKNGVCEERTVPQVIRADPLKDIGTEVKLLSNLTEWLTLQLDNKDSIAAPLTLTKFTQPVVDYITNKVTTDSTIFEKPASVLYDLKDTFCMSLELLSDAYTSPGFLPKATGQWYLPITSTVFVMGVIPEALEGTSFVDKMGNFLHGEPASIAQLVTKSGVGFCGKFGPGDMVWLPPGYLLVIASETAGTLLKWASMANDAKKETSVVKKVLACASLVLSSYPTLAESYKDWIDYLENSYN